MPRRPHPNRKKDYKNLRGPVRLRYDPEEVANYIHNAEVYIQEWVLTGVKPLEEPTPPQRRAYYD